MQSLIELLATLAAGLFAGAAVYINVAEHPARMLLDADHASRQWAESYARATRMQAPLALIGFALASVAWWQHSEAEWLVAGILLLAVVPFTLVIIMPINRRLLEPARNPDAPGTRPLLEQWNRLHAVRSVLGLAAFVLMLWCLGRQQ